MSENVPVVPAEEMGLETIINDKLVKANITDKVIAGLKEAYGALTINGQEDKAGYKKVVEARKECKKWRVLAGKICKEGREDAVKIQKKWVEKEKEVTGKIEEVEEYLQKQEDEYDAEKERLAAEEKSRIEAIYKTRNAQLLEYGAYFDGSNYILGEALIELDNVKSLDDEMFNEKVLPKFKAIFDQKEAERLEKERLQKEEDERIEKQREELRLQQEKLEKEKEELRLRQEEADRKELERILEEKRIKHLAEQKLWRDRLDELDSVGWNGQFAFADHDESVTVATYEQLISWTDEEFEYVKENHLAAAKQANEEKEKKRLAEIEEQKKAEEKRLIGKTRSAELNAFKVEQLPISPDHAGDLTQDQYDILLSEWKKNYEIHQQKKWQEEQDKKKAEEERLKQEELDNAKDKEKWAAVVEHLGKTPDVEMRSSQYRTKMKAVKDFLATIK